MTTDFNIPFLDAGGSQVDPDTALIAAFIAGELSAVQIVALYERVESDAPFREQFELVLKGWTLPVASDTLALFPVSSLTRAEFEAGWTRATRRPLRSPAAAVRTLPAGNNPNYLFSPASARAALPVFSRPSAKIAAIIALIVLPLVTYAASTVLRRVPDAPQPESARSIDDDRLYGDAPVQFALTSLQEQQVQSTVPVIDLSFLAGKSATLAQPFGLKELSDGRVMINDPGRRQLRIFDADLASSVVALDSVPGSARSYESTGRGRSAGVGRAAGAGTPVIPWLGDSVLLRDFLAPRQMRVIDGNGRVARAMDLFMTIPGGPPAADLLTNRPSYADSKGRLLYKGIPVDPTVSVPRNTALHRALCEAVAQSGVIHGACPSSVSPGARGGGAAAEPNISIQHNDRPDSIPIHRADLDARRIDTVGFLRFPPNKFAGPLANGGGKLVISYDGNGAPTSVTQVINPVSVIDEWAVLSDGTIAIVRGQDYHVDWIHPDGSRSASPKLPIEWKRISDADKAALIDSVRAAVDSVDALALWGRTLSPPHFAFVLSYESKERGIAVLDSVKAANGGALPDDVYRARMDGRTLRRPLPRQVPYEVAPASQIPDYHPPFGVNAAMPDRDGNLWILPRTTSLSKRGELVYDVVNPREGLVKRVRLPVGRSIAGFGKGAVFLQVGDITNGFTIEKMLLNK